MAPTANADAQRLVSLYADGQKRVFATQASNVGQVLGTNDVHLASGDIVEPAIGTAIPSGFFNVNVYRARPVLVQDGYHTYHLTSAYDSPRLLAQAAGLQVYPEDTYKTEIITDVVDAGAIGVKVTITRAKPITVKVDGKVRTLRTQADTVGAAMKAAGIDLGLKDTVSVPLSTPVAPDLAVAVARVSEVEAPITQVLPKITQVVKDPSVLKGQTAVRTEGVDGQKIDLFRIHYQDGREVSRELIKPISQVAAVNRVEVVGTKVLFAGSVEYWRPMVEAAAAKWNYDPNAMMRIMACESGGSAVSVSHFIVNGEHPMGLFQYLPSTWRASGGTDNNILDGPTQIEITARKMATQGTGPWQCK